MNGAAVNGAAVNGAAVVLLTPVVFATAAAVAARPRPQVYACTHLANSASLLLPVSNLTNLLAFSASGLSFTSFAGLMAAPWVAPVVIEYAVFRWYFRGGHAAPRAASRFVLDHAPCQVLLVWPEEPPGTATLPHHPKPPRGRKPGPPGPPGGPHGKGRPHDGPAPHEMDGPP